MPIDFDLNLDFLAELNKVSLCNVQPGLFPTANRQATFSNASQSRSESCIAINPRNPRNMVGASKKFIDPHIYLFRLGVIYTFDGGNSWQEATLPMRSGWDGMTDPTVAFDDFGNCFLVGEPLRFNRDKVGTSQDLTGLGMVVYRSTDGGATWQEPIQLTTDTTDDKQWVICDNNRFSPHYGNIYVVWAASSPLRFARSTDHGQTWTGKAGEPAGSTLVSMQAFAPELAISPDGTLHLFWHNSGGSEVKYLRSTNGGSSFAPLQTVVVGMESLSGNLPEVDQWPHFENSKFRVLTLVTSCTVGKAVLVAWADMREGRSRIYYRRSPDGGATWEGPAAGQPLLPNVSYGDSHCFHPQIVATETGVVGCAFYVFGKEFGYYLIRVQLAGSWDKGVTFPTFVTVTDKSWDPLVNAPAVHGNGAVDFIGEYFGLDAGEESFALLWTDTRTGVQELFFDEVQTKKVSCPHIPEVVGQIFGGVASDGGGFVIVGGKIIKIPPWSPLREVYEVLGAFEAVGEIEGDEVREMRVAALKTAVRQLERILEQL
ncbi:MAG: exo-alpha-sialidase [Ardenticatenaceae bacterium]|nr:exo-alpha-sialidase [Ardenticatenaceae bacterium]